MEEKYSRDRKNSKLLKINFIGSKQTDETPKIGIFKINLDRSVKKIESISNNQIDTTKIESIVKNSDFGFGPDIDENDVTENMLISYRTNTKLTDWLKTGIIEIDPRWRNWILPLTCVYGKVEKCTPNWPFVFEILPSITSETKLSNSTTDYSLTPKSPISSSINIFPVCSPICNAVVEIYQKTCCCKITLPELDLWLEKLKKWIWTLPPPLPDPPIPGPDPYFMDFVSPPILDPTADKEITRSIKRTISGGLTPTLGNPSQRVIQDVKILLDMPRSERIAYVNERQYLVPIFCTCSSKKIKEVPVNQNGEFSSCFLTNLSKIGCTTTFYYKVKQWQGDKFVYIYDGSTNNEYFESNEEAILKTWKGFSCDSESPVDPGDKFVLLENIGSTRSYKLQSPTQNSEFGVMSANNTDGLVNINFPDQPWAYVLHFRLRFSPGMKALGAKFYRISIAEADSNGNPISNPEPLFGESKTWYRWVYKSGNIETESVFLGDGTVTDSNGKKGLYEIPHDEDRKLGWLSSQYHKSWDTRSISNRKYLVIAEIFDKDGVRLKPNGSTGDGVSKSFTFRRWINSVDTNTVPFAALTHLFHINNKSCFADIVDFRKNGNPSLEECQFIAGCTTDNFSIGFYAYHQDNFMHNYSLIVKRGLNGPVFSMASGTTNAPNPYTNPPQQSNSKTLEQLLQSHQKCSFSVHLIARPKHTNGSRIIWEYHDEDIASVALEKEICINPLNLKTDVLNSTKKLESPIGEKNI